MDHWHHLRDRSESEPHPGDEILLVGPDGEPDGKVSKVKVIVSEAKELDLWEVIDSFNQVRVITESKPRTWLEVEL